MNRRRFIILLLACVLVGAGGATWYTLLPGHPLSSPGASQGDSKFSNQESIHSQQTTEPDQVDGDGATGRVTAVEPTVPLERLGIRGRPAPSLQIEQWHNLPTGMTSIDVIDYRGKVIYLYSFQSWCPGCHRYGFPTLAELIGYYKDSDDIVFIAVQTSFEGHGTNTPQRAKETADGYGLTIPVGHSGSPQQPSAVMRNYRTGGTPWTVIIDRNGIVRFNDFHIESDAAVTMINRLLACDRQ